MDDLSSLRLQSIYLETWHDTTKLSDGTGFFIRKNDKLYLITASHVLTRCDYINMKCSNLPDSIPNRVQIHFPGVSFSDKNSVMAPLITNNNRLFTMFKFNADAFADIAILPIHDTGVGTFYPVDYNTTDTVKQGDEVIILGFPYGNTYTDKFPLAFYSQVVSESFQVSPLPFGNPPNLIDRPQAPGGYINLKTMFGLSGAPVYQKKTNKLIGIISSGWSAVPIAFVWNTAFIDQFQ